MDIKLTCNSCGQHVLVNSSAGGASVNCPTCATVLIVPQVVVPLNAPPAIPQAAQKQRSIGWGVFWGLFGFFITLPLCIIIAVLVIGVGGVAVTAIAEKQSASTNTTRAMPVAKKKLSEIKLPANLRTDRDEVRNLTFIKPRGTENVPDGCSCYLYAADNGDGDPVMYLRCRSLEEKIFIFDEVVFRIGSNTHTLRHDTFEGMQHDRIGGQSLDSNEFAVSRGANFDALKQLLQTEDTATLRFHNSTDNRSKDFILKKNELDDMRAVFLVWGDLAGQ